VKRAAIDSTGLECSAASGYFIRRRSRVESPWKTVVYHHYPKLGVVSGIDDHFIYAYQAGRGPRPDVDEFRPLVADALQRVRISQMAADAGYDSEPNHKFARDQHGIRTVIPPKHGRPTTKPATGRYRRLMQVRFDPAHLSTAGTNRDPDVDDQTTPRRARRRTLLLEPMSRPPLARSHPQCPTSCAWMGFLQSLYEPVSTATRSSDSI
jgi:hypothetical protein